MAITVSDRRLKSINFYWFYVGLLAFAGCGEGPPTNPVVIDRRFRTTPPARIYFQNIRSTAYQLEQSTGDWTYYYVLRSFTQAEDAPLLYPVIADIWMEDQAHLLLRLAEKPDSLPVSLKVTWQANADSGSYRLDTLHPVSLYEMSLQIDRSLRLGHRLSIQFDGQTAVPLLTDSRHRDQFRLVIQDYLRLTE